MPFLRPPSPTMPPATGMDSSPMDISLTSPVSTPSPLVNPLANSTVLPNSTQNSVHTSSFSAIASQASLLGSLNPLARLNQSPTPTHLKNRSRRPSSLSLGLGLGPGGKGLGLSSSSPNCGSSGVNSNGSNGGGGLLPPPNIVASEEMSVNRERASSSASSMSFGFSPSRRSLQLDDASTPSNATRNANANEETPTTAKKSKGWLTKLSALQRKRQIGISGANESESSLSARSDGRNTPDLTATNGGFNSGLNSNTRPLEQDVDALAVDGENEKRDQMPVTPPRSATSLTGDGFQGLYKPPQLLKLQRESAFLDAETRSEAAFTRLVSSTSDLASRLRLTISTSTPSSSPARSSPARKKGMARWMEGWGSSSSSSTPVAIGGSEARSWAGRFPETAPNAADADTNESDSTDSDDDPLGGTMNNTLIVSTPTVGNGNGSGNASGSGSGMNSGNTSRPPSQMGMDIVGRSRSGSMATALNADGNLAIGSFGGEGMDLDMVSTMSSPISTPLTNSWREPAPFIQSKKRKVSAMPDSERTEYLHAAKRRKGGIGLSPANYSIPLSSGMSTSDSSNLASINAPSQASNSNAPPSAWHFAQQRSPYLGNQLQMTSVSSTPYNIPPNSSGIGAQSGWGGAGSLNAMPINLNGNNSVLQQHKKSGSMSTMAWSRPGSAGNSPLMRPTTGGASTGAMPAPSGGFLLGPSLLSNSTTEDPSSSNQGEGEFEFGFDPKRVDVDASREGSKFSHEQAAGPALGGYGAQLTDSPSSRPMRRLPERALRR